MLPENQVSDTETAAAFLTLMGNEKRLAIMNHLIDDELTVARSPKRWISANLLFRSIWQSCEPSVWSRRAATGR